MDLDIYIKEHLFQQDGDKGCIRTAQFKLQIFRNLFTGLKEYCKLLLKNEHI